MSNAAVIQEINNAIRAHGKWKFRLKSAISHGKSDVTPETARCDDRCDFGKWLHGSTISKEMKAGQPYAVVKRLHGEFHQIAGTVMQKALDGHPENAQHLLNGEYVEKSNILTKALSKWKGELKEA